MPLPRSSAFPLGLLVVLALQTGGSGPLGAAPAPEPPRPEAAAPGAPATPPHPAREDPWRLRPWTLSLEVHGGFFGLLNLDREFTEQDPSFGFDVVAERRVHRLVDIGAEVLVSWMKTVVAPRPRLVLSPQLRGRVTFGLGRGFSLHLILGLGATIWPADDSEAAVSSALTPTRAGWSLRVAAGAGYALSPRWGLVLNVGYYLSSTAGRGVWATLDCMQVTFGVRLSL